MPDSQPFILPPAPNVENDAAVDNDRLLAQPSTGLATLPAQDAVAARAWAYVQAAKAPVDRHGGPGEPGFIRARWARSSSGRSPGQASIRGHSLRAGFAIQAARNGATVFDIMRQTGHRSVQTVARYVREAQIFHDSPAQRLGL